MTNPVQAIPLWQQLQACATVVQAIMGGASATAVLERQPAALRPGVQALSFQALRSWGMAQALCQRLAPRKPQADAAALLGTALALAWDDAQAPYAPFTLVNQSVEAAKRHPTLRRQAAFINACLRRFLREREALVLACLKEPQARWNHPLWWIARVQQDYPQQWQAILQANNRAAPLSLRVNSRRSTVPDYLQRLRAEGIEATAQGAHGVQLSQAVAVQRLPGFATGDVSVQDLAGQMAAPLLLQGWGRAAGLRVLDACAAPGGKTAHLLELSDAQVTALDIDPARCERMRQNLQRLGLHAQVLAADAAEPQQWWDGQLFDAILLDAPCTASGIVRRHPDVRWLRRESDVAQLARIQAQLLKTLWPLLRPGGRLLYCTCSVFRAEGVQQIETFLAHNTQARLQPSPGHLLPYFETESDGLPDNQGRDHDGFYYALLEKSAA